MKPSTKSYLESCAVMLVFVAVWLCLFTVPWIYAIGAVLLFQAGYGLWSLLMVLASAVVLMAVTYVFLVNA